MTPTTLDSLAPLVAYLVSRREAILNNWRTACQQKPDFNTTAGLNREEFNNKVPFMLNELEHRLLDQPVEAEVELLAAEHGLHRWQKGYALHELLGEIHVLNQIMLDELRQYWQLYPSTDMAVNHTYEQLAWFTAMSIKGSIEQYMELQRIAASSRAQTLEKALDDLNGLIRQRGDLLRTASHDLRGGFSVIQGAATLLNMADVSPDEREQMLEMLSRNLTSVRTMVIQLMDLARLEASQEPVTITSFDAGELLHSLMASYQPLAAEKGLLLKADGPSQLMVKSDPLQLQRIIQNLVLNALKHTDSGWISVSWSTENDVRWLISVQDSGPGLPKHAAGLLAQLLAPTQESSAAYGIPNPEADARETEVIKATKSFSSTGEGIGLSIVKRLCELLGASLEIETQTGRGTLFRIRMPIHYQG